ncbi:MAG: hypothetical protein ACQES8_02430 [Thermodesulfobacteriota bacterium]
MTRTNSHLKIAASLISFALCYWIIFIDPVINQDGILYIRVADQFLQGNWSQALDLYPWPFYSLVIAAVSKMTSLGLEASAYLITASCAAILTYVFISMIYELDRDKTVPFVIAAFVIVFFPELNETRAMIIRGHGYWSFYLLAILCFSRFYRLPRPSYAWGWNLSIIIATLFRIEGLVFLLLLPLTLLFRQGWSRMAKLKNFLTAHLLTIIGCLGILVLYLTGVDTGWVAESRLSEPLSSIQQFLAVLSGGVVEHAAIIENRLLNEYSADAAIWIALSIPVIICLIAFIKALTPVYTLLLCWKPGRSLCRLQAWAKPGLLWVVFLNLLIIAVAVLNRYFFTERFVMPLVLILLLILGFTLSALYDSWRQNGGRQQSWRRKWISYAVVLLLIANSGKALVHSPGHVSKKYLKDAGNWLQRNAAEDTRIFTNNVRVSFYSGDLKSTKKRPKKMITAERLKKWSKGDYDYLALWVDHRSNLSENKVIGLLGGKPLQRFANGEGDLVLIYRK